MPYLHTASLRPSLLALAIVSNLPTVAYAAVEDMTVTATGKVVKRSYENDGWYYTLKIHDGSEIKMSESHVINC